MNSLFCDGGVIKKNPSKIGGTWACKIVNGSAVGTFSGVITPAEAHVAAVTNNLTEMFALVNGLMRLDWNWVGTIYSDSQITIGRAKLGWKWKNIPQWLYELFGREAARHHDYWDSIQWVLLGGHPTKKDLERGFRDDMAPVHINNVWCDQECQRLAKEFLSKQNK